MGIVALVIEIITAVLAFIPCVNILALIPGFVGLLLGIISLVLTKKAHKPIGSSIAGIALNGVVLLIILLMYCIVKAASANQAIKEENHRLENSMFNR